MKDIEFILTRIEYNTLLAAKKMLNIEDVAFLTGLSKGYIYKLTCSHQIPYYKPFGKQIYFDRAELEEWLRRNRIISKDEVEQGAVDYLVRGKGKRRHKHG